MVDGTFNVNAAKSPQIEIFGRAGTINLCNQQDPSEPAALEIFRLDAAPGCRRLDHAAPARLAGESADERDALPARHSWSSTWPSASPRTATRC